MEEHFKYAYVATQNYGQSSFNGVWNITLFRLWVSIRPLLLRGGSSSFSSVRRIPMNIDWEILQEQPGGKTLQPCCVAMRAVCIVMNAKRVVEGLGAAESSTSGFSLGKSMVHPQTKTVRLTT